VPMTLLYELGLLAARFYVPKPTDNPETSSWSKYRK
jgi:Sec-independent protein secretion pathway component TatC